MTGRKKATPSESRVDDGAPLSDKEREQFNAIMGRLKHLEEIRAFLAQRAADSPPDGPGRKFFEELADWPGEEWNTLARAIATGRAWTVTKRQTRPGKSGNRAHIAHWFGYGLGVLCGTRSEDPRDLPDPVRRSLIDLVGVCYLGVDIHRSPREAWVPRATEIVDATLAGAFTDDADPETNIHAAGAVAAGVGCAARLFGVTPRTIWTDRKGALLPPAASLAFAIALRYGDDGS